jgi:hypothetical protein
MENPHDSLPSSFQCSLLRCLLIVVVSTCRFELPPHTNIPLLLCQWHAFFTTEKSSSMRILKQFTLMPAYKIVYTLGNVEFYMVSLWASDDAKYNSSYCNRKHGLIKKVMMFGHYKYLHLWSSIVFSFWLVLILYTWNQKSV